ncbi:hypothetical protein SK128_002144 [Halocaridina rubra]|uniref:Uncharacterized protein n=1 Tax=Halocaridina rubra TaxID=373956 RepID=A0AAN8WMM2_HALRR
MHSTYIETLHHVNSTKQSRFQSQFLATKLFPVYPGYFPFGPVSLSPVSESRSACNQFVPDLAVYVVRVQLLALAKGSDERHGEDSQVWAASDLSI